MADNKREADVDRWDTSPLLDSDRSSSDIEAGHTPVHGSRHVRTGSRFNPRKSHLKWPLLLAIGITFFLLGLGARPASVHVHHKIIKPLVHKARPNLKKAQRVRELSATWVDEYPIRSGDTFERQMNVDALDRLAHCLEKGTCGPGEEKVVLLASYHFKRAHQGGTSGEDVWARSTIKALQHYNYTMLLCWGHMDTLMIYQHIPDMVPAILWEASDMIRCKERNATHTPEWPNLPSGAWQTGPKGCMQRDDFPQGIPYWKSFLFFFWTATGDQPLGPQWVLSPEDYNAIQPPGRGDNGHYFLGYSIEWRCKNNPIYPEREHRGLILAKEPRYFEKNLNYFHGMLAEARDAVPAFTASNGTKVNFDLMSTAGDVAGEKIDEPGIVTAGRKPQKEWSEILARSKVLVGIGRPQLSPSPYDALCVGVPFINVIFEWNQEHPDDRRFWETQQNALKWEKAPYVYHVRHHDKQGLIDALSQAAVTPIDRYIPEKMSLSATRERVRTLVETDWYAKAVKTVTHQHGEDPAYQYLIMPSDRLL